MFDGGGDAIDNEPIKEVDNVQSSDVVVNRVGFKDVDSKCISDLEIIDEKNTY